jgi:hypothetical protein
LHSDDGGYSAKVLAEQQRLKLVASGRPVPAAVSPTIAPVTAPAIKADESVKAATADEKLASANLSRN